MKKLIILAVTVGLSGCAAMQESIGGIGRITTSQSSFDGSDEVQMTKAWILSPDSVWTTFGAGLLWSSQYPNRAALNITMPQEIVAITSVQLNIDGEITTLQPINQVTKTDVDYNPATGMVSKESSKHYNISMETLKGLLSSADAKIKVNTNKGYVVGDFYKADGMNILFIDKLPDFLSAISK